MLTSERKTLCVAAIHQPNFFPWIGYFDKIFKSDKFIFLDHVQYQKTGGTWQNRVKLNVGGQSCWVTAPIVRNYHGVRAISDMEFQIQNKWRNKIWNTLTSNYSKHKYFVEVKEIVEPLIFSSEHNVAKYNIDAIVALSSKIGIASDKFYLSSQLECEGDSNKLLVSLVKSVGATTYLSGDGADEYMDEGYYSENDIKLVYQSFKHPKYPQRNTEDFIAGLSIIDVLMNIGFDGVKSILQMR